MNKMGIFPRKPKSNSQTDPPGSFESQAHDPCALLVAKTKVTLQEPQQTRAPKAITMPRGLFVGTFAVDGVDSVRWILFKEWAQKGTWGP